MNNENPKSANGPILGLFLGLVAVLLMAGMCSTYTATSTVNDRTYKTECQSTLRGDYCATTEVSP